MTSLVAPTALVKKALKQIERAEIEVASEVDGIIATP